jgi:nicotinamidase/pyrazinamidase
LGQQILWPDHCVQGSLGAEFPQELESEGISHTVFKGTDPAIDSYSAFFDNARQHKTDLDEYLRSKAVTELYVAGLATDYCVFFTVMDALSLGYKTYVLVDAVRGVELKEGDCERALKKMNEAGAALLKEGEALPPFLQTSHPS